ncbi:MAG: hypothetical protein AAF215_21815 [Cyanobacteria bacterium P01_A01_bin.123]
MFATLIDRLGDRNPQLLRELKGRLNWRNILIAVGLSLLAQLLVLLTFMSQLPEPFHVNHLAVKTLPELNYRFEYPPDGAAQTPDRLLIEQVSWPGTSRSSDQLPKSGDYITAIDGKPIASFDQDWHATENALRGIDPGLKSAEAVKDKKVELQIERNGQAFKVQLPRDVTLNYYNNYCKVPQPGTPDYQGNQGRCVLESDGQHYRVAWQWWYADFFRVVSIVMAVALLSAGSFLLIQNIDREQRRGTLTFVRLSPRSVFTVLGGQILGTPIVVYLAIALSLPLHLGLGLLAGFHPLNLAIFYGFLLINCGFFFSLSLLYGLLSQGLGGFQAWLFGGAMFGGQLAFGIPLAMDSLGRGGIHHWIALFSPMAGLHYIFGNYVGVDTDYALAFAGRGLSMVTFSLLFMANGLVWSLWVWHGLRRKFINPNTPLIHRPLSYLLTVCFEVFLLGFASNSSDFELISIAVASLNLLYFGVLMAVIQPTHQAMADWARFRHVKPKRQRSNGLLDGLLSNQSPSLVALAVNLGIAYALISAWVTLSDEGRIFEMLLGMAACMSLILVYGAINQIIFVARVRRPSLWSVVTVVLLVVVPLFMLGVFYGTGNIVAATRLQLLAAPWLVLVDGGTPSLGLHLFALLGQWTAIVVCMGITSRRLKQIGASESKAVLTGSRRLPRGV